MMDIKSLLSDLLSHNVESFEGYGIKVSFKKDSVRLKVEPLIDNLNGPATLKKGAEASTQQEMPTDPAFAQSIDGELPFDQILNWSATPDPNEKETPLTGDSAPLTSEG